MNPAWKQCLSRSNATFLSDETVVFDMPPSIHAQQKGITPLTHLAVLQVSGQDARAFLQGQTTCNLTEISEQTASFGAFCNNKGRVISTFLILKQQQDWLLLVPTSLLPALQQRLQKYILRAKVNLIDGRESYCLIGLSQLITPPPFELPNTHLSVLAQEDKLILRLGEQEPRYIILADAMTAQQLWLDLIQQGYQPQSSSYWTLLDMYAGIPWLCADTCEEYIPQMLNLEQLGGISFNKGCYTGQEIVARTHYLGQSKRALYTATAHINSAPPKLNSPILDAPEGQQVGKVLAIHVKDHDCTLLIVLATEASCSETLVLQDYPAIPLKLA